MRPNIPPLTSLRFFAALAVVVFHYDRKQMLFPQGLCDFGYEAVTFFFILSGFILTYTHGQANGLNVGQREFAASRLVRIVPAYVLGLLVAAPFFIAAGAKAWFPITFWTNAVLVPAMLQSWWPPSALAWNPPAWSLSNEIFFYAMYPGIWAVWRKLPTTYSLAIAYFLVLLVSALRLFHSDGLPWWHDFAAYFPLLNLPQFVLGVALGKALIDHGPLQRGKFVSTASLGILMIVVTFKSSQTWLSSNAVLCVVFGALIYSFAGPTAIFRKPLSSSVLTTMGNASYAIYILHVPLWFWWDNITRVKLGLTVNPAFDFMLYLVAVLSISFAAMQLIEVPSRRRYRAARV